MRERRGVSEGDGIPSFPPPALPLVRSSAPTIVSGLPRSGTSLVMQILEAAGLPLARDDARPPDADNPRGYHELAAVKRLRRDAGFLEDCRGRAVKIVAPLVVDVSPRLVGRVLYVERDLDEVLASQRAMLGRSGSTPRSDDASTDTSTDTSDQAALRRAFEAALEKTRAWLEREVAAPVLFLDHRRLVEAPRASAEAILSFLERTADPAPSPVEPAGHAARDVHLSPERARLVAAMAAVVDPALHRQRTDPRRQAPAPDPGPRR